MLEGIELAIAAKQLALSSFTPYTFDMSNGTLTASDPNGPTIIQLGGITYRAYLEMGGLDLSSQGPPEKGWLYYFPRHHPHFAIQSWATWLLARDLIDATLRSTAQPLQLDEAESDFPGTASDLTVQVYTGTLEMTWTTSGLVRPAATESSPVDDVRLRIAYRVDQPAEVSGTLVGKLQRSILDGYQHIHLVADSASPLQAGQVPPPQADYPVQNARLHIS